MPDPTPNRRRLVIIGGGFSGAALALQALSTTRGELGVHVIDRFGGFGPGLAYSTTDPTHLLNVHAERMSVLADTPGDFQTWLQAHHDTSKEGFAPRQAYGAYLSERMSIARQFADRGALTLTRGEAVACRVQDGRIFVSLDSGASIEADIVVLATGHPPAAAPFDAAALSAQQYKSDPWDSAAIATIGSDQDVALIGTGLTMIDMVLSLTRAPRTGRIYALSRRGLMPRPHAQPMPHGAPEAFAPPIALSEALAALRREAKAMEARGEPWQRLMDRLRPDSPKLWRRLAPEQQKRFLRHARPYWDVHRHRAAPHAHAHIAALQAAGQLQVIAGKITDASASGGDVEFSYTPRGADAAQTLRVAAIVNCTGADPDIRRSAAPLMRQMLADGLIRPHVTGVGADVTEDGRLIGAGGAAANLYAIGPPTQGAFWESTAVPEIRRRADELAGIFAFQVNTN